MGFWELSARNRTFVCDLRFEQTFATVTCRESVRRRSETSDNHALSDPWMAAADKKIVCRKEFCLWTIPVSLSMIIVAFIFVDGFGD